MDRRRECAELATLYGREPALTTEQYFNSGVLVMSQQHVPLLEALRKGPIIVGHPQFEQGLMNILVKVKGIPIYDLPTSLNHILHPDIGLDWRFGSFIHVAGAGKRTFRLSKVWTEEQFDGVRYLTPRDFKGRFVRLPRLLEIALQVAGQEVRIFDVDDLLCDGPSTYHELVDETLLISLGESPNGHAIWGPYVPLDSGRWHISVLCPDGGALRDPRVMIDVCWKGGAEVLLPPTAVDRDIIVDVPENIADIETRLAIKGDRIRILAIRLEREGNRVADPIADRTSAKVRPQGNIHL
jgi:hypothetical protein